MLAPSAIMFVGKLSARGGPRAVASKHQSKTSKVGKQGTKLIPLSKREDFASEELGPIMRYRHNNKRAIAAGKTNSLKLMCVIKTIRKVTSS